jgi:CheY-like chemotaxis protein
VLLQIWDTGSGIHQEELNKIFSDFYRSGDHSQQGIGLGLGVVARLSQQLKAPVQVRSTLGKGSCFSIELPICANQKYANTEKPLSKKVGLAGLSVLCVDDKQENLDAMQTFLDKWQVNITTSLTPDKAMAALKTCEPQVILMDYHLDSEMNGLQLIAKIRKSLGYPVPAILITANQDDDVVTEAFNANCKYLSKPVKPAKLRSLLQAVQAEGVKR